MTSESSDVMTSQDTGGAGFPGARAAARSAGRVRSLRWLPASPGRNARGWGATGGGSCVLDVGRAFVQYAQPLASRSPPSWSRPSRERRTGRAALRRCHRDPGQGPGGADGGRGARPPPPRPRGVAPASGPVSTQWTSTARRRLQGNRPAPDSRPSERLRSEETRQTQQADCVLSPPRAGGR